VKGHHQSIRRAISENQMAHFGKQKIKIPEIKQYKQMVSENFATDQLFFHRRLSNYGEQSEPFLSVFKVED
jgi:hypothetical protein